MTIKHLLFNITGMALAYAGVLIVPVIFDFICDTHSELYVIAWLNVGLFVMRMKKIPFPEPAMNHIDIVGGLRVLWWALFWPRYLLSVK